MTKCNTLSVSDVLVKLVQASRLVALEDNSDNNPQAVELREALSAAEKIIEDNKSKTITFEDIDFNDPKVQSVYEILTSDTILNDKPSEEHWEGFLARKIVHKLFH